MSPHHTSSPRPRRAIVVGSGPNGLTAAAFLARDGWEDDVYERNAHPGGAAASAPALGDGTVVDLGATGHPFGVASPAFRALDLTSHGLEWVHTDVPMAHPLPHGQAAMLFRDVVKNARWLGQVARPLRRHNGHHSRSIDEILASTCGLTLL